MSVSIDEHGRESRVSSGGDQRRKSSGVPGMVISENFGMAAKSIWII